MSSDSTGLFSIGKDVEKYCGISKRDVIKKFKEGKENSEDAIIYGMSNTMNGGADIYLWVNAKRLSGAISRMGFSAIMEILSHESVHLTHLIFTRFITSKLEIPRKKWINYDFQIDEENFATGLGNVIQTITPKFLDMFNKYIAYNETYPDIWAF